MKIRLWVLIIAIGLSILAISPSFEQGIVIKSVEKNSTAFEQGLRQGMVIKQINYQEIKTIEDYSTTIEDIFPTAEKIKLIITTKDSEIILFTNETLKITVDNIPKTKIKTGLDLQGGARALVKPEKELTQQELDELIAITTNRINVFGISDVNIRAVTDLVGNKYMLVEIAGATPTDLKELVAKQGKFEAKIGNQTVFIGGERDITSVCRTDARCAGIETCSPSENGYACRFRFAVYLSEEAAKRHADITSKLGVNISGYGKYLDKPLDLYIDGVLVDSLLISEGLQGQVTTQISVQGSGTGATKEDAYEEAFNSMKKLQTVLITGSLPYKLEIVKLDSISAVLGDKFIHYIFLAGIAAILGVAFIVFIRYRKIKSSLALLLISFSEILIILGFAAFINWNLDIAAIAGILIVIGTGVDHQIIMLDESRIGIGKKSISERLKQALFIIVGAYFTSLAALVPLYWVGAGLLKGFAFTTIAGITIAVLITRPAFAEILKKIET